MANYLKRKAGVGDVEMSDEEHAARVAEEEAYELRKPAKAWDQLRMERNKKLAETDYLALKDVTLSSDMRVYRRALRDFPATLNDTTVLELVAGHRQWPTKP